MTQATQTAPNEAREASMSRVQTQDTILASAASSGATSDPARADNAEADANKDAGDKPKKPINERIQDLVARRKEAEAKADAAVREAQELKAKLAAVTASAKPIEVDARPLRSQFATDEDYTDAVAEWKTKKVLAEREAQQEQARQEAEQAAIASQWSKRQAQVMKELPDYLDVVGKSEINLPGHVHQFILESENGPHVAYFLALHPEEANRIAAMKPLAAVKHLTAIERELADIGSEPDEPANKGKDAKPTRSKAPEPIEPVRSTPSAAGPTSSYEEYKRRRQAGRS